MATAEQHMGICDEFLVQAREEFDRGDLLQASEKAWGAVAHCVKAISEERGWEHNGHRQLITNARALLIESGALEADFQLIPAANGLRQNFYENWFDEDVVRDGINGAARLVAILQDVHQNGAA